MPFAAQIKGVGTLTACLERTICPALGDIRPPEITPGQISVLKTVQSFNEAIAYFVDE